MLDKEEEEEEEDGRKGWRKPERYNFLHFTRCIAQLFLTSV